MPVIGVASSSGDDDWLRDRARSALDDYSDDLDPQVVESLHGAHPATCRATTARATVFDDLAERLDGKKRPLFYLAIPPVLFDDVIEGLARVGINDRGPGRRREAVRSGPRVGARAQRRAAPGLRRVPRCSASTTTSARSRSRTCWCSGSPTRCSSRSGTATSSRTSRSRWPRTSASGPGAGSTRASVRSATSCRTTCCRSSPSWPWSRRRAATPRRSATRRPGCSSRCARSIRTASCGASTATTPTRRASTPAPTSRPTSRCGSGSTRGGGPASRSSSAPASASR